MLALIYEVIWFRLISQLIGSSLLSTTIVTAVFLGGNALGAIWGGYSIWISHPKPLRLYGLTEGVIAILCGALLFYFDAVLNLPMFSSVTSSSIFMALGLAAPALLMGTTLPVLTRSIRSVAHVSNPGGFVYLWNILGASAGVIAGGVFLVPYMGAWMGTAIATSGGILLCLLAMTLGSKARKVKITENDIISSVKNKKSKVSDKKTRHFLSVY